MINIENIIRETLGDRAILGEDEYLFKWNDKVLPIIIMRNYHEFCSSLRREDGIVLILTELSTSESVRRDLERLLDYSKYYETGEYSCYIMGEENSR